MRNVIGRRGNHSKYREDIELNKDNIIKLYTEGTSIPSIAKLFNISDSKLRCKMVGWGINTTNYNSRGFGKNHANFKGYEDVPGTFVSHCKKMAKKRGIDFNITAKEIYELFISQNKKCKLSGEILRFCSYSGLYNGNVSLDRIDSNKGYYKENCQLLTQTANLAKNEMSNQETIDFCNKVTTYQFQKKIKKI